MEGDGQQCGVGLQEPVTQSVFPFPDLLQPRSYSECERTHYGHMCVIPVLEPLKE